ncbi:MAG: hypothetical protein KAS32_15385 [Candidatus Peribacteraceae bacterium]|nr:hypothetical protein [Candidatus Peribacteraceae bacterium]
MFIKRQIIWQTLLYITLAFTAIIAIHHAALAASEDVSIVVRPHCEISESGSGNTLPSIYEEYGYVSLYNDDCVDFFVEDPQTLKTAELKIGDEIDMDIVIRNPSKQPLSHGRTWLSYDPTVLEGISMDISREYENVTPGESDFDTRNGYVMIEASTETPISDENIVFARIKFKVNSIPPTGTPISFYDPQNGGHTAVSTLEETEYIYVLSEPPGSLHVTFSSEVENNSSEENESSSEDSNVESSENSSDENFDSLFDSSSEDSGGTSSANTLEENQESSSYSSSEDNTASDIEEEIRPPNLNKTAFSLIQIRNVRATTEGSSLYIGWDSLKHSSLKAYNIYYGTTSGRYIQRKTISEKMDSLILRSLPIGTAYFVAIRAVADNDEESAFSQEVSVKIGDPSTATSPLIPGSTDIGPEGVNPLEGSVIYSEVPGETGIPSILSFTLIIAAIAGTLIAVRRQSSLYISQPNINDE